MLITKGYINIVSSGGIASAFDRVEMVDVDNVQLYNNDEHKCGIYEPGLTEFLTQCHELGIKVIDKRAAA